MKASLASGVSILVLMAAAPAFAQARSAAVSDGAASGGDTIQTAPPRAVAGGPAAEADAGLNEVVVTAEKLGRTLQNTATSVGTVTAADIANQAALEIRDVYEQLPNVGVAGANNRFEIRGIAFDNVTGAGNGQLGALYVDGVRLADKSIRFGPDLLWDVNTVQVLRGAQSTLQGRNALAGVMYINTNDPTYRWTASARVLGSNGGGTDQALALGGPIIDDKLAFRVSAERHTMDGFVYDPVLGRDIDSANDVELRGKLLFQPTDKLTIRGVATYANVIRYDAPSDLREVGSGNLEVPNPALGAGPETGVIDPNGRRARVSYDNVLPYDATRTFAAGVTADYRPMRGLTLTSSSSYQYTSNYKQRDDDSGNFAYTGYAGATIPISNPYGVSGLGYANGATVPVNPIDLQREKYHTFDQEFRARYDDGGPFRGLVGVFYTHEIKDETNFTMEVYRNVQSLVTSAAQAYVPAAIAKLIGGLYSNDAPLYTFNSEPVNVENFALYTEDEYDLTGRLTLDLGMRYDHERNISGVTTSGQVFGLANPAALASTSAALATLVSAINASVNPFSSASSQAAMNFHAFLPKASLRYKLADNITIGGDVQRAYRAGGVSVNVVRQLATNMQPEYTWNYELFMRSNFFDKRVRFNANVFYTDWTHQQVAVDLSSNPNDTIGVNAGRSLLYGYEAQLDADLTRSITLHAGVGHSHTEFLNFNVQAPPNAIAKGVVVSPTIDADLRGNAFPYAPRYTGDIGADYHRGGYFVSASANYQSTSYSDVKNTEKNGARTLINARTGYNFDNYTFYLFVRNLFDRTYVQDANVYTPLLGEPRVFGAALQAKF